MNRNIDSVAAGVRCSRGENEMLPISITPISGWIRMYAAMPTALPVPGSNSAWNKGSSSRAALSIHAPNSSIEANGPTDM